MKQRHLRVPQYAANSDTPETDFQELTAYILSTIALGFASIFNKGNA